jgi:hypothetical protein
MLEGVSKLLIEPPLHKGHGTSEKPNKNLQLPPKKLLILP